MPEVDEFRKMAKKIYIQWIKNRTTDEDVACIATALRTTAKKHEKIGYEIGYEDGFKEGNDPRY